MMTLADFVTKAKAFFANAETHFEQLPPEYQTDATALAKDGLAELKGAIETGVDAGVTGLDPKLAPAIIPMANAAIAKIDADAADEIATVQAKAESQKASYQAVLDAASAAAAQAPADLQPQA